MVSFAAEEESFAADELDELLQAKNVKEQTAATGKKNLCIVIDLWVEFFEFDQWFCE